MQSQRASLRRVLCLISIPVVCHFKCRYVVLNLSNTVKRKHEVKTGIAQDCFLSALVALKLVILSHSQGTRSNFEIGGGAGGRGAPLLVSDSILGGTRHFFLLTLYHFKNIGGHVPPPPAPLLRGP